MTEAAKKKKIFDGRYEVLSIVGRGAASVVYHARHVGALTSEVALKVLLKQNGREGPAKNSDLLRKEALAMVSARHKYVVRLDDFHSIDELCYLAMEYASLGDTRKYISSHGGKLTIQAGELFLTQCAEALDFVHRVGIVHRDIKPDNILVISDKEIRLADFGVAVLPGETPSLKDLQAGVGTMTYMAPEVLEGISYDKRSDIYSLGVTFYELLSGVHPFEKAPLIEQLNVRQDKNIAPLNIIAPEVPQHISNVIMQAISYDPAQRFASCQDLIQTLLLKKSQPAKQPAVVEAPTAQPKVEPQVVKPEPVPLKAAEPPPVQPKPQKKPEIVPDIFVEPPPAKPAPQAEAKPKRSLEDLRNLARETKSDTPTAKAIRHERKQSVQPPPSRQISLSKLLPIILALAFAFFLFSKIFGSSTTEPENAITPDTTEEVQGNSETKAPDAIAFPALPRGIYHGAIQGMMSDKDVPLSIVSLGAERGLIVIIGLQGFSPQLVSLENDADMLHIAANGLSLDFRGKVSGNRISGDVVNIVSGEKGSWSVEGKR